MFLVQTISFAQQPLNSEDRFKNYFHTHFESLDQIQGIWSVNTTQEYYHYDTLYEVDKIPKAAKIAIMKKEDRYESFNLNGELYNVQFTPSEVAGVYFYKNYFPETKEYTKAEALISKRGEMEYNYEFPDNYLRIKLGDSYEEGTRVVNKVRWEKIFPENKR